MELIFKKFGAYIEKATSAIRKNHPNVAVVLNHYHRPNISWEGALPLDNYDADLITGSEATGLEAVDLTMRLCRAYGRGQSEVWRPIGFGEALPYMQHAMQCFVSGGHPSFGGDGSDPQLPSMISQLTPAMRKISPYVDKPFLPYIGFHASQQTESFFLGRSFRTWQGNPFWAMLQTWTNDLGGAQMSPDYFYDAKLNAADLAKYKAAFFCLSPSLTDTQAQAILDYAANGGVAILGPGVGQVDAMGEKSASNKLQATLKLQMAEATIPAFWAFPETVQAKDIDLAISEPVSGFYTPLTLNDSAWISFVDRTGASTGSLAAVRDYGKGKVIATALNSMSTVQYWPTYGGDTQLTPTTETSASGAWSLKYTDGPTAAYGFYPDLETRFTRFDSSLFKGGELSFDIKMADAAASAQIEIRSSVAPIEGPQLSLANGQIASFGQYLCALPQNQWIHVVLTWAFADGSSNASYVAKVTLPNNSIVETTSITPPEPRFAAADWLVIYGPGQAETFYVDNIEMKAITKDNVTKTVFSQDFERGPDSFQPPLSSILINAVMRKIHELAPPQVNITGPEYLRAGIFSTGKFSNLIWVHIFNRQATLADWTKSTGPSAEITLDFKAKSARSLISNRTFNLQNGTQSSFTVLGVGLYEIIEIERERSASANQAVLEYK